MGKNSCWLTWMACSFLFPSVLVADEQELAHKVYGVGVLGNCCTHGAGICTMFTSHPRTRVVAAFESDPRRAQELQEVLGRPLATSYEAVLQDGTPPTSNAETAVVATEVLMAAYQSIIEQHPVSLPLASGANPLVAAGSTHR